MSDYFSNKCPLFETGLTPGVYLRLNTAGNKIETSEVQLTDSFAYLAPLVGAATRTLNSKLVEAVSVKDFGATGNGTTDDTAAFTAAQAALGTNKGTVFIPYGNYVLNDWVPRTQTKYQGAGIRASRLVGTTSSVISLTSSREMVSLNDLAFTTIASRYCILTNTIDGYAVHWSFNNVAFEDPAQYGIFGQFCLSEFNHCFFGYVPGTGKMTGAVYLKANAAGTLASNGNLFKFCKFYRTTGPAVSIEAHGYGNIFEDCDFETLDDKAFSITQGNQTKIIRCWFENINLVTNSENCVVQFGSGNAGINEVTGCYLGGTANFTDKFFSIGTAEPGIVYDRNYIGTNYTNLVVVTLTASDIFWYQKNKSDATGVTVTAGGYDYYTD